MLKNCIFPRAAFLRKNHFGGTFFFDIQKSLFYNKSSYKRKNQWCIRAAVDKGSGVLNRKVRLMSITIEVKGDIEKAIRLLKKKMIFEGVQKELSRRRFYEKPSVKKKRKRLEAGRRRRKAIRQMMWPGHAFGSGIAGCSIDMYYKFKTDLYSYFSSPSSNSLAHPEPSVEKYSALLFSKYIFPLTSTLLCRVPGLRHPWFFCTCRLQAIFSHFSFLFI